MNVEEKDKIQKGHPPSVDLRYGEEDSISPSSLINRPGAAGAVL